MEFDGADVFKIIQAQFIAPGIKRLILEALDSRGYELCVSYLEHVCPVEISTLILRDSPSIGL